MEITSIQIELAKSHADRLRGFCRIVFDDAFLINDIRVLESDQGYFVAMPSRKVTRSCPFCAGKNHLSAKFCNDCGKSIKGLNQAGEPNQRAFSDIAHPINSDFREKISKVIIDSFLAECDGAVKHQSNDQPNDQNQS